MDKQTKLFITTNGETKEVSFTCQTKQTEPLFVFSEYGRCQIELQTNEDHAYIEIESMTQEGIIKLMPSHPFWLSDPEKPEEGYIPGNFSICYSNGDQRIERFFTVLPQSLSEASLKKMCQLLEEKAQGVTRNLYSHQLIMSEHQEGFSEFDLLGYLIQQFDELMESLNRVLACPIEDLVPQYQLTKVSKKQDAKSLRWTVTKGQRYVGQETQEVFYEKRNTVSYNTVENRALKHMISQISTQLLRLSKRYRINHQLLLQQQQQLLSTIDSLNQRKNNVNDWNYLKKTKGAVTHELYVRQEELTGLNQKIEAHQQYYQKIQRMNGRLMAILNESWMSELPMSFSGRISQRFFKTPGYAFIYSVYQELTKPNPDRAKAPTFPLHQTSRLFEYYNVFLVIELLQQQGFEWKSGWLKDFNQSNQRTHTLEAGEELFFEDHRGYQIRVSYDKFLKTSEEAKFTQEQQLVSVNSSSRRPDLLIELFYQQTFLSSMIIEVKYRKLYSIYQEVHETNAMKQLMDYRALNYYDPTQRPMLQRQAVDTILTVYPNHEGSRLVHDEVYDFKFIPLSPTGFEDSVEGVSEIKKALVDFLNRY